LLLRNLSIFAFIIFMEMASIKSFRIQFSIVEWMEIVSNRSDILRSINYVGIKGTPIIFRSSSFESFVGV
jgi:hypothetical protein